MFRSGEAGKYHSREVERNSIEGSQHCQENEDSDCMAQANHFLLPELRVMALASETMTFAFRYG